MESQVECDERNKLCKVRQVNPWQHLFQHNFTDLYVQSKFISLAAGTPGPHFMKSIADFLTKCTEERMKYEKENLYFLFQYGPTLGSYDYRINLAKFLSEEYCDSVSEHDLVLNSGASSGFLIILSTLLDFNGVVFVDEATYMIALRVLKEFNTLKLVKVPWRNGQPDVDKLKELAARYEFKSKDKMFWAIYYTMPVFHNPTGVTFTEENCQRIIDISRTHNFLVVCDDVYNMLSYGNKCPPKRLFAYDNMDDCHYMGNVISNGTFSKILFPGIRLGWLECPPRILKVFSQSPILQSGGAINHYTSGIVTQALINGDIKRQLEIFKCAYEERIQVVYDVFCERNFMNRVNFNRPAGGFFIWLAIKDLQNCDLFNEFCQAKHQVVGLSGNLFSLDNTAFNYIRISIAFHDTETVRKAIHCLCNALEDLDGFHKYREERGQ